MAQRKSTYRRRSVAWLALALIGTAALLAASQWDGIKLRYTVYKLRRGHEGEQHKAQAQLERLGGRCLPLLRPLLDDPHPRVRYLAVDTLLSRGARATRL